MKKFKLKSIPKPPEGSCVVLDLGENKIKGKNKECIVICGKCGNTLAENISKGQIKGIVLNCKCGNYNIVPYNWSVFRLVDFKNEYNFFIILIGLIVIIFDRLAIEFFPDYNIWIGLILIAIGAILNLFNQNQTKYFED